MELANALEGLTEYFMKIGQNVGISVTYPFFENANRWERNGSETIQEFISKGALEKIFNDFFSFEFDHEGETLDGPFGTTICKIGKLFVEIYSISWPEVEWDDVYFAYAIYGLDVSLRVGHESFGTLFDEPLLPEDFQEKWKQITGKDSDLISRSEEDELMMLISPPLVEILKDITQMVTEDKVLEILKLEEEMDKLRTKAKEILDS